MSVRILVGDCRETLRGLQAGSVHAVVTSPPYWGLRDYGVNPLVWGGDKGCVHEWGEERRVSAGRNDQDRDTRHTDGRNPATQGLVGCPKQTASTGQFCHHCHAWRGSLGLEPTPALYVQHMVEVFREVWRVLRDDGQMFLNIGDTRTKDRQWCGIPHRLVFALQDDGWRFEDEVVWEKPNCMPGSQTNRFTRSHEFVFMLNKSKQAYFDMDAVREAAVRGAAGSTFTSGKTGVNMGDRVSQKEREETAVRSKRSVWTIPTQAYSGSHFAVFPQALVEPCIKAGTSERGVCPECGAGWVRVVNRTPTESRRTGNDWQEGRANAGHHGPSRPGSFVNGQSTTTGWQPGCGCYCGPAYPDTVPAVVCDPFGGSGTVGAVCNDLGRDAILCELNQEYVGLIEERCTRLPMFDTVEVGT